MLSNPTFSGPRRPTWRFQKVIFPKADVALTKQSLIQCQIWKKIVDVTLFYSYLPKKKYIKLFYEICLEVEVNLFFKSKRFSKFEDFNVTKRGTPNIFKTS